ncbi:MAG: endonuclease, partial [Burkholderiales bacterium]|nr:endonuclease [Burkholderiales bacterium]
MIRSSKVIFTLFFILFGAFKFAEAADINLLDINVQAWKTLTTIPENYNGGGPKFVNHIMANQYDFVTTQENDRNALPLTDARWGNMAQNYSISGPNGDATIYFRKDRWTELKSKVIPITSDKLNNGGLGPRVAGLSQFQSKINNKVVTIVT